MDVGRPARPRLPGSRLLWDAGFPSLRPGQALRAPCWTFGFLYLFAFPRAAEPFLLDSAFFGPSRRLKKGRLSC